MYSHLFSSRISGLFTDGAAVKSKPSRPFGAGNSDADLAVNRDAIGGDDPLLMGKIASISNAAFNSLVLASTRS
jgi:hypothetical protein